MAHGPRDGDGMIPLVVLVRRAVHDSGLGLNEFAKQRRMSYSTLQRYHNPELGPLKSSLRRETIETLARALNVPMSEVERAADDSVGRVYRQHIDTATVTLASLRAMEPAEAAASAQALMDALHEFTQDQGD